VGECGSLDEIGSRARDLAEAMAIEKALRDSNGNKSLAAEALRVNYKRLLARIRDLDLEAGARDA
jgi:transcriptional regulator with PAS, ATPase and Fis domain